MIKRYFQNISRTKKKRNVTYEDSFKGFYVILHYIIKTICIRYPAFHFRPSNSKQDTNLTDFHCSRPSNKIVMLHILCTRCFFVVLVIYLLSLLLYFWSLIYIGFFSRSQFNFVLQVLTYFFYFRRLWQQVFFFFTIYIHINRSRRLPFGSVIINRSTSFRKTW